MRERLFGVLGLGPQKAPEETSEKPKLKETDLSIEIGNSTYLLSKEAQKYLDDLRPVRGSDYEKSKSVLIVHESHYSIEGQFNLYKFLETFFRDNPTLIPKTTFLAEGFPANQTISVKPLIEVEPNPDEELIWEVLSTFLITGYVAYEWKYQQNIPIVGTEDTTLYQLSSRLWPTLTKETIPLWNLTIDARNKSMANMLMEKIRMYENPILFAGGRHIDPVGIREKGVIGKAASRAVKWCYSRFGSILSPDEAKALRECKFLSIFDYLEKEKIGATVLTPRGQESAKDGETYKSLFRAQQSGDYRAYIEELISEKSPSFRVTGRPSPEAAAEFLKAYRKAPPANPEARASYQKGLSLMAEGKYIEAAEEFSAASAADPEVTGYVFSFQDSLFKEGDSRIIRVTKDPDKGYKIKPGIEPDLPIFGPYIEEGHYERVSQFDKIFARIPGKQEAINNAMHRHWETKFGGILQIKAGQQLGPENVRAFEERHHLKEKGLRRGERVGRVDIATKDDIAIECKNVTPPKPVAIWEIHRWVDQAATRFEPDIKGYRYKGVIIVIPDDKNPQEIEPALNEYINLNYPSLLGKIKICQVSQLKETYSLVRGK